MDLNTLEFDFLSENDTAYYIKIIVNKTDHDRVIGFHYLGKNVQKVSYFILEK